MSIKIGVKQIIARGVKNFRVKKIQALKLSQLPAKYEEGEHVFLNVYDAILFFATCPGDSNRNILLRKGVLYNEEEFEKALVTCRKCGENLTKINKALEEENKDWDKEMTYII